MTVEQLQETLDQHVAIIKGLADAVQAQQTTIELLKQAIEASEARVKRLIANHVSEYHSAEV